MPRPPSTRENHSVRIETEVLSRLDVVAAKLTERAAGAEVTRAATMRAAMIRGLDELEVELGIKRKR